MTREEAFELLKEYNKDNFHIRHALTVEGVMKYFAEKLGYGEEKEFWGIVGLLHDLDFEKYPEEHLEMLFPLFALYYKQGNDKKAKEYLDKINKANPHFIKLFKGTMTKNKDVPKGYYSKGDSSEILMYFSQYAFLINTMPTLNYYVLENSKNKVNN